MVKNIMYIYILITLPEHACRQHVDEWILPEMGGLEYIPSSWVKQPNREYNAMNLPLLHKNAKSAIGTPWYHQNTFYVRIVSKHNQR